MKNKFFSALTILICSMISQQAISWGGRGHHTICEAAAYLTKEKALHEMLIHKTAMMGHLCNIPDIYWKSLGSDANKLGNPTHFIDVEILNIKVTEIPLDYQQIVDKYSNTPNHFQEGTIFSIPTEFGSNWWRADQFFRRAVENASAAASSVSPKNSQEEQNDELPYNKNIFSFINNLGLMGHFVGDNGQPFHTTADYDGYKTGHGGIHSYFEEAIVAELPPNLVALVVDQAKKLQQKALSKSLKDKNEVAYLNEKTVLEKMRSLGGIANQERQLILKMDTVSKPSSEKNEHGMSLRKPAERQPAEKVASKFKSLIVNDMARSAALLAQLWDLAYVQAGKPDLKKYRSYKYAFTPDFVAPDYLPKEKIKTEK